MADLGETMKTEKFKGKSICAAEQEAGCLGISEESVRR